MRSTRKVESIIGVGLGPVNGMMHTMHVRGYQNQPQYPVNPSRDDDVGVVEHCGTVQNDFNRMTATADAPRTYIAPIFSTIESAISIGWKRMAVVTSMSRSTW